MCSSFWGSSRLGSPDALSVRRHVGRGKGGGASWDAVGFSVLSIIAYLGVGALLTHAERPRERLALV